jgi:hypothetical protein
LTTGAESRFLLGFATLGCGLLRFKSPNTDKASLSLVPTEESEIHNIYGVKASLEAEYLRDEL